MKEAAFQLCMSLSLVDKSQMSTCTVRSETDNERSSISALHDNVNSWSESKCWHDLSALKQMLKETALQLFMSMSMSLVDQSQHVDMHCPLWNKSWKKRQLSFACQYHTSGGSLCTLCFLIHRTCDLQFPPQTSAWCPKSPLLQIQSENVPLQKASDDFHSQTHKGVERSWQFPVYLYIYPV